MNYICARCKQTSSDGNLWCQDLECPAGQLPMFLRYGDMLGYLRIVRLLRALPTGAVYEAESEGRRYLLKIATPGYEDYLHQEAEILYLAKDRKCAGLPQWMPHGAVNTHAWGEIDFRGRLQHYLLMNYQSGEFLADTLLSNPQPWHQHVGWFMRTLAEAVMEIHRQGKLHLNLTPDSILVWRNSAGVPQPLLLDMGMAESPGSRTRVKKFKAAIAPSYASPELLGDRPLSAASDVYVLGVLMFEMLKSQPAYPYKQRNSADISKQIISSPSPKIERRDLPQVGNSTVADIALTAMQKDPGKRYQQVGDLLNDLNYYGPIRERPRWYQPRPWQIALLVSALTAVFVVISVMLVLATMTLT